MTEVREALPATLERLVTLDVPKAPAAVRASLPGAAISAAGMLDPRAVSPERMQTLEALATAPAASEQAALAAHAYFTEIDMPVRLTTREAMRPGAVLSEAALSGEDSAALAAKAGAQAPRAGDAARTRFRWNEAAPEDARSTAAGRFSWQASDATGSAAHFSWEAPPPSRKRGRTSLQEPAPALVPRGWIPAGPLTRPLDIELPEMAPTAAKPEAETAELRHQRLALRIQVCRDAYRMLGELGLADDDLRAPGRALATLDELLDPEAGAGAGGEGKLSDPEPYVAQLPGEALGRLDRLLNDLEDKLLELDERITPGLFRERIEQKRHSRTRLARYARLLASRRFNAGERRDRFEWLATRLLTVRRSPTERAMIPREDARNVLKHLIGGLPARADADELPGAIENLKESLTKLDAVRTPEELFDSGTFLDAHGYKVSMRDHLLSPDFVYLSVAIHAKVENMLETWIAYLERAEPSRAVESSSARARVYKLLADQETEVDRIFGVRRVSEEELTRATRQPEAPKKKRKEQEGPRFALPVIAFDRTLATIVVLGAVIVGAAGWLLVSTGTVAVETIVALQANEVSRYSPLLQGGYLVGTGENRYLKAMLSSSRWSNLTGDARWEAAEDLAEALAADEIQHAEMLLDGRLVVVIHRGRITEFER